MGLGETKEWWEDKRGPDGAKAVEEVIEDDRKSERMKARFETKFRRPRS